MSLWNEINLIKRQSFVSFFKYNVLKEKQCFKILNINFFLSYKARSIFTPSKNLFSSSQLTSFPDISPFKKFQFQSPYYAIIHIYDRPFIVTEGDTVTIPQRLRDVKPGDIIKLTCVSKLGSRDYTLKGQPYIDEKFFTCRARVLELTKAPMSYFIKKKRRQRRIKIVKNKQDYTVLRISEIKVHEGHN
ncbi:hypothetical protein PORY_000191 [Pneumocystis oryctolagi]|uniref:Uncharacterized protein n=1 Tax=Pneumocystis oryctolagi TaxID=42067 RepID=A0ACB7CGK4_9ASCO|nr:hypothetical protein PORY_000191 [Pneumocystis oryctolagi]